MSEKYLHFRKRQKHVARKFFPHPVEINGLFFESCVFQRYKQKFERNWNNSVCIEVDNFPKSVNF